MSDELENTEENEENFEISFNIEDGSCVSEANSYISLEEANQYMTNKGRSNWLALSDDEKKVTLINGTQYVDNLFTWKGRRKFEQQELSFPRVMIRDLDGFEIRGIPKRLKEAVCEAAFYGFESGSELFTTYNENGAIKRQRVEGAVEVEFFDSTETAVDYISKYAALNSILKGLYEDKNAKSNINAVADWGW